MFEVPSDTVLVVQVELRRGWWSALGALAAAVRLAVAAFLVLLERTVQVLLAWPFTVGNCLLAMALARLLTV